VPVCHSFLLYSYINTVLRHNIAVVVMIGFTRNVFPLFVHLCDMIQLLCHENETNA
jgi:hypothetical protein